MVFEFICFKVGLTFKAHEFNITSVTYACSDPIWDNSVEIILRKQKTDEQNCLIY